MYNLLLRLYPSSFRNEYAEEMRTIFARRRQGAGAVGAITLWLETIPEIIGTAALVHWDLLRQDLSYTARTLRRAPGFAITAVDGYITPPSGPGLGLVLNDEVVRRHLTR